jgi:hypothetical protein
MLDRRAFCASLIRPFKKILHPGCGSSGGCGNACGVLGLGIRFRIVSRCVLCNSFQTCLTTVILIRETSRDIQRKARPHKSTGLVWCYAKQEWEGSTTLAAVILGSRVQNMMQSKSKQRPYARILRCYVERPYLHIGYDGDCTGFSCLHGSRKCCILYWRHICMFIVLFLRILYAIAAGCWLRSVQWPATSVSMQCTQYTPWTALSSLTYDPICKD